MTGRRKIAYEQLDEKELLDFLMTQVIRLEQLLRLHRGSELYWTFERLQDAVRELRQRGRQLKLLED